MNLFIYIIMIIIINALLEMRTSNGASISISNSSTLRKRRNLLSHSITSRTNFIGNVIESNEFSVSIASLIHLTPALKSPNQVRQQTQEQFFVVDTQPYLGTASNLKKEAHNNIEFINAIIDTYYKYAFQITVKQVNLNTSEQLLMHSDLIFSKIMHSQHIENITDIPLFPIRNAIENNTIETIFARCASGESDGLLTKTKSNHIIHETCAMKLFVPQELNNYFMNTLFHIHYQCVPLPKSYSFSTECYVIPHLHWNFWNENLKAKQIPMS